MVNFATQSLRKTENENDFLNSKNDKNPDVLKDNPTKINLKQNLEVNISTGKRRSSLFSAFAHRSKTMNESTQLSFFNYSLLWIKNLANRKKSEVLENLDYSQIIKKKIFNEFTIYKLYFEVEKLKLILLNQIQLKAFDLIKVNYSSIIDENRPNFSKYKEILNQMDSRNDKLSQKIAYLLRKNL